MGARVYPPVQPSEDQFQQQVLGLAKVLGWLAYHTRDSRRSQPGFPDLVLVHALQGRVIYAELKSAGGRLSDPQRTWLAALATCGAEVALWRPADLGRVKDVLRGARVTPGEGGVPA